MIFRSILKNQKKIEEYNNNIVMLSQEVKSLEPEFEKNSKLFWK